MEGVSAAKRQSELKNAREATHQDRRTQTRNCVGS